MYKLIAVLMFSLCNIGYAQSILEAYHVVGDAYDSSGKLLYTETLKYTPDDNGGQLITHYTQPDNKQLAIKEVSFTNSLTAPDFSLIDLATEEKEGVEWQNDGQTIRSFQGNDYSMLKVPDGPKIFDAGFDNFIKLNWDTLIEGKVLKVNYLFARENKFLKLRLQKSKPPKNSLISSEEDQVFFKISANNVLFRMLSSPLFVGYDINSQSLRYYSGPSNLPMMKDKKQVLIVYRNQNQHLVQHFTSDQ